MSSSREISQNRNGGCIGERLCVFKAPEREIHLKKANQKKTGLFPLNSEVVCHFVRLGV